MQQIFIEGFERRRKKKKPLHDNYNNKTANGDFQDNYPFSI